MGCVDVFFLTFSDDDTIQETIVQAVVLMHISSLQAKKEKNLSLLP